MGAGQNNFIGVGLGTPALTVSAVITKSAWGTVGVFSEATITVTPEVGTGPAQGGVSVTGTDDDAWQVTEWGGEALDTPVALDSLTPALSAFSIEQGETFTFKIRFIPISSAAKSCTLTITNSDGSTATSFSLSGTWSDTTLFQCKTLGALFWAPREASVANAPNGTRFEELTMQGPDLIVRSRSSSDVAVVSDAIGSNASLAQAWSFSRCSGTGPTRCFIQLAIETALSSGMLAGMMIIDPNSYTFGTSYTVWCTNYGTAADPDLGASNWGVYSNSTQFKQYTNDGAGTNAITHGSSTANLCLAWRRDVAGSLTYVYLSTIGGTWKDIGSMNENRWSQQTGATLFPRCSDATFGTSTNERIHGFILCESELSEAQLEALYNTLA